MTKHQLQLHRASLLKAEEATLAERAKNNVEINQRRLELVDKDFIETTSIFINALTKSTDRKCVNALQLFLREGCLPALHNNKLIFLKIMEERKLGYKNRVQELSLYSGPIIKLGRAKLSIRFKCADTQCSVILRAELVSKRWAWVQRGRHSCSFTKFGRVQPLPYYVPGMKNVDANLSLMNYLDPALAW